MNSQDQEKINQFEPLLSFKWTWVLKLFFNMPFDKIGFFTGNQSTKTFACTLNYVFRLMGWHPIPRKNVLYFECPKFVDEKNEAEKKEDDSLILHPWVTRNLPDQSKIKIHREGEYLDSVIYPGPKFGYPGRYPKSKRPENNLCTFCGEKLQIHKRKTRIFRFGSEILPEDKESTTQHGSDIGQSTETKNTVYPEFKKWLPPFLIKSDISSRRKTMILYDPNGNNHFGDLFYPASDIVIEFIAYHQTVKSGAGVQRLSCYLDEESPIDIYEEQMPRLVAEDADILFSLTPAEAMSWTFDEIFERAQLYIRTKTICDYLRKKEKRDIKQVEWRDNDNDIVVIQAATDDNPTLSKKAIEKKMFFDDEETVAIRRYGIFKQSTGRIFNDFSYKVHSIDFNEYGLNNMMFQDF